MKINLPDVLQEPYSKLNFGGSLEFELDDEYKLAEPAQVQGECSHTGEDEYLVTGILRYKVKALCALCLKEVTAEVVTDFEEKFSKEQDEDSYQFSGNELNLDKMLQDTAILSLPMRVLCSEMCKGLCPKCGKDLNVAQCGCNRDESNPFAVLKKLDLT